MEENYNKQIGQRIKHLRETKGEYQKETAEAITRMGEKLSEGQLGLYEIGARKLPPNITKALAEYFNVTSDYLLGRTNTSNTVKEIDKKLKENNLHIAANSKVDLGKLAKLDDKQAKIINNLIDDFLEDDD